MLDVWGDNEGYLLASTQPGSRDKKKENISGILIGLNCHGICDH